MTAQHPRAAGRPLRIAVILALLLCSLPAMAATAADPPKKPTDPAAVPTWEWITLDGYMRGRGSLYVNHDLDRGSTPTTGAPLFPIPPSGGQVVGSLDARFRLDLGIHIGEVVQIHARVDALDNLVLGSTPQGFPRTRWAPMVWASVSQDPPASGVNAFTDSIRVKRAYGQVLTPIGLLVIGRMGLPTWGLGVVAAGSDTLDADVDDAVDRIGFVTTFREHFVGVAFDINATGPTTMTTMGTENAGRAIDLELRDNVYTVSAVLGRDTPEYAIARRLRAGKATFDYGSYITYRWQRAEFPGFYLQGLDGEDQTWSSGDALRRDLKAVMIDLWLQLHVGRVRVELEGVFLRSRIGNASMDAGVDVPPLDSTQAGGALQVEVQAVRDRLALQVEVGLASGDRAPGLGVAPPLDQYSSQQGDFDGPQFHLDDDLQINNFRFHPNHHVDVVFWRQIAGTVTDAAYGRFQLQVQASRALEITVAGIPSFALRSRSTPSGHPFYGGEVDLHVRWRPVAGFELWGDLGLFIPGRGLDNPSAGLGAKPALGAHLMAAFVY
jgi:uncharacterized protein (TIGR04551 family)